MVHGVNISDNRADDKEKPNHSSHEYPVIMEEWHASPDFVNYVTSTNS
jgi:hypothetical protein